MKLKEIAELAGVSPATVSLVLNNRSGVSDSTRACVEELLLSHGYAVRGKEDIRYDKRNILFIRFHGSGHLFEAVDDFYERIFDGADASAKLLGYTITVTNINLEGLPQLLKDAELQNTDGIIFFASEFEPVHAEMLTETSLPLVVVDSRLLEQPINSVTVESMCSVYQALKYLYDLGHRRIGFLTADEATGALPERQNAFYLCQKRLGLELRPQDIVTVPIFVEPARQVFQRYLDSTHDFPTAFFAYNDIIAAGALKALAASPLRVPEDISIVGFDDSLVCTLISPSLTTMRIQKKRIGELAVHRLHEIINGDKTAQVTLVNAELVVRETTAPPKR